MAEFRIQIEGFDLDDDVRRKISKRLQAVAMEELARTDFGFGGRAGGVVVADLEGSIRDLDGKINGGILAWLRREQIQEQVQQYVPGYQEG
jgi:hypothetical protein